MNQTRRLTITLAVEMLDHEVMADYCVPALLDYCGALVAGDAGQHAHEFYEAGNGIVLRIEHEIGEPEHD